MSGDGGRGKDHDDMYDIPRRNALPTTSCKGGERRARRGEGREGEMEGISSDTSLARHQLSMELSLIEAHSHLAETVRREWKREPSLAGVAGTG